MNSWSLKASLGRLAVTFGSSILALNKLFEASMKKIALSNSFWVQTTVQKNFKRLIRRSVRLKTFCTLKIDSVIGQEHHSKNISK